MILELIALIIFCASAAGIIIMLYKKLPVLLTLPQNGTTGFKKHRYILNLENKIKDILAAFEKQVYLHKILSWLKCQILKIEVKIDYLLHNIRQKSKNKPM